jgi:hypothetical protein
LPPGFLRIKVARNSPIIIKIATFFRDTLGGYAASPGFPGRILLLRAGRIDVTSIRSLGLEEKVDVFVDAANHSGGNDFLVPE